MKRRNLIDAAAAYGANRKVAREFFKFSEFEDWKKSIWAEFERSGRVGYTRFFRYCISAKMNASAVAI